MCFKNVPFLYSGFYDFDDGGAGEVDHVVDNVVVLEEFGVLGVVVGEGVDHCLVYLGGDVYVEEVLVVEEGVGQGVEGLLESWGVVVRDGIGCISSEDCLGGGFCVDAGELANVFVGDSQWLGAGVSV